MLITHCSLTIFTNCFGFGRQNCEHWSYWVLMTTSLELSVFFNFNPKRRRWRRASMKVGNKAKMKVILMTRLIILKYRLSSVNFEAQMPVYKCVFMFNILNIPVLIAWSSKILPRLEGIFKWAVHASEMQEESIK